MASTIKPVFEQECKDMVIDSKLIKRLAQYTQAFINKNEGHINFFGGNLLGVDIVKYTKEDRERWFGDVLDIDDVSLTDALHDLDIINEDYVRISDTVNLTSIWLLHAIFNSKHLNPKEKEKGMIDVCFMLQVKFLTSVFAHYFKWEADKEIAQAVYESLSRKYSLKVYGSWYALIMARSQDIIARNSIHYKTITHFDDDDGILYAITDTQQRMREIVKKMYVVLVDMRDNRHRITSTSSTVTIDGTVIMKDKTRNFSMYKRYLHEIIPDKQTFIRNEIVEVITKAMHTMPEKLFLEVLEYTSLNYAVKGNEDIGVLCDETLLHVFDFLSTNKGLLTNSSDLGRLITRLRALYMASRMVDPTLLKMRDLSEGIVLRSASTRNQAVQSSLRTGLQLYLVLRTFTMQYYS